VNPLEFLGSTQGSIAAYVWRAWLAATAPALLYFLVLVSIGADTLRPPAGTLDAAFAGYSVLVAPLLETALMIALALLLKLMIPHHERIRIVLLALICAFAHKIGGSWQQVFASAWPFLVYSVTLAAWLKRSSRTAFMLTALVHALYNATFFAVGALGLLLTAPA
jgi:hypothetical protein